MKLLRTVCIHELLKLINKQRHKCHSSYNGVKKRLMYVQTDITTLLCSYQKLNMQECTAMHALDHENLIRLYGIVLSQPMMMIVELAPLGSLIDWMHKQMGRIPIVAIWDFAIQIGILILFIKKPTTLCIGKR